MSYYTNKSALYGWTDAIDGLRQYLRPEEHPALWSQIKSRRLGRVPLALLKILLERRVSSEQSEAFTNAVKTRDLSDVIRCNAGSIADAANRINELIVRGVTGRLESEAPTNRLAFMRDFGLVMRNQYGITIWPGLVDVRAAIDMSRQQIAGVTKTWRQNERIAKEARQEEADRRAPNADEIERFNRMTPDERREFFAAAARTATDGGKDRK